MWNKCFFILVLFISSCTQNKNEFKDGRLYKHETFEEWDERTKDSEIRRKLDSNGVDSNAIKQKNSLKQNPPIRIQKSKS